MAAGKKALSARPAARTRPSRPQTNSAACSGSFRNGTVWTPCLHTITSGYAFPYAALFYPQQTTTVRTWRALLQSRSNSCIAELNRSHAPSQQYWPVSTPVSRTCRSNGIGRTRTRSSAFRPSCARAASSGLTFVIASQYRTFRAAGAAAHCPRRRSGTRSS